MATPEQAVDYINGVYGRHPGYRALHAKGRFYAATFTASAEATVRCRAAHLQGTPVPAIVRLSNGSGHDKSVDRAPDVRGLAVSFHPSDGVATDLVAQTAPRFPVHTVDEFLELTRASALAPRKPWLLAAFLARHPSVLPAMLANLRAGAVNAPGSFAEARYYAVHAYRWVDADGGSLWVRYTWLPEKSVEHASKPDRADRDYLQNEIASRLRTGPVRFRLSVHIAAAGDDPHDPTSVWRSPNRIDAGTLEITGADPKRETGGELIVFDPTRVIDGIELSDDPILRFRPLAYSVSAERRT
jgi:catalase